MKSNCHNNFSWFENHLDSLINQVNIISKQNTNLLEKINQNETQNKLLLQIVSNTSDVKTLLEKQNQLLLHQILQKETEEITIDVKNDIKQDFEKTTNAPIEYWRTFNVDNYIENLKANEFHKFLESFNSLPLPCLDSVAIQIEKFYVYELKKFVNSKVHEQFKQRNPWPRNVHELQKSLFIKNFQDGCIYTFYDKDKRP